MKQPARKNGELLDDIQAAPNSPDRLDVWWLGQSGFLVKWNGFFVLFDPYLSDSLTLKYAGTEKPHVRMTERVIDPSRLDFVNVVTSTHNHTDHLDAETLNPLRGANPNLRLIAPEANRAFAAERLGCDPAWIDGMDAGESLKIESIAFHAVPAAHESLDRDEAGRHKYLGYIAKLGPWTVYHSGDTVRYGGMAETLAGFNIDLAFLPVNGRNPKRGVPGNLWGREAAQLAADVGIGAVIPCHYDMFEFNTVTPDEFREAAAVLGVTAHIIPNGGHGFLAPDHPRGAIVPAP